MSLQRHQISTQLVDRWVHVRTSEEWKLRARCRGEDPDLWFPHRDEDHSRLRARAVTRIALELCGECPVARDCLGYAMTLDLRDGIWGGMTERQRRKLRGVLR